MSGGSAKDLFELGVVIAASLFLLVYMVLIRNAESMTQAIDIFGRTLYVLVMAVLPTSEIAVFLDFVVGTLGASVAASKLRAELVGIIIAFGFGWTATNIIINWFTAPI